MADFRRLKVLAGAAALVAVALLASWLAKQGYSLHAFTAWLQGLGPWGPAYWILIVIAAVVFLLPVPMLAALAGFLFGALPGTLYNVFGMSAGCAIAFLLGRLFFSEKARGWMEMHPRLRSFNRGLENQGWTFILSTRLLPGFPLKVSNYAFGGLGYPYRDFLIGNTLGIIPYQLTGAYAGSLLSDLSDPGKLAALTREPLGLAVSLGGLAAAAALLTFCVRRAMRAMREQGLQS